MSSPGWVEKKEYVPHQGDPKTHEDSTGDLIDHGKVLHRQFIAEFARHHHLSDISRHIDEEANGKDDDPLAEGMAHRKNGGITQPEKDHAGVKRIDDEPGGKDPGHVALAEPHAIAFGIRAQHHLFEKNEIDPHRDQE